MSHVSVLGSPLYHFGDERATACGIEAAKPFPVLVAAQGGKPCQRCVDLDRNSMVLDIPMMNAAVASPPFSDFRLAGQFHSLVGSSAPVGSTPPVVSRENRLIETSMSALDTFSRCRRKYMYQEVLGWEPRNASKPMTLGILYHAGLAAGYRAVRAYDMEGKRNDNNRAIVFIEAAVDEVNELDVDRDGKRLDLTPEDRTLVEDMIRYWFQNYGEDDLKKIERVVMVEEPLYIQIGRYRIRCTLDAIVQYFGHAGLIAIDHKTGDPKETKEWIALDVQTGTYYVAARGRFGQVLEFHHRFQARDVPPGFGHRSLKTDTGKERSAATLAAMQDPARYYGTAETSLSDAQLDAYTEELVELIQEVEHARETGRWPRSRIKVGVMKCSECPYFDVCKAERDGYPRIDEEMARQEFLVRGSVEWNALHASL